MYWCEEFPNDMGILKSSKEHSHCLQGNVYYTTQAHFSFKVKTPFWSLNFRFYYIQDISKLNSQSVCNTRLHLLVKFRGSLSVQVTNTLVPITQALGVLRSKNVH